MLFLGAESGLPEIEAMMTSSELSPLACLALSIRSFVSELILICVELMSILLSFNVVSVYVNSVLTNRQIMLTIDSEAREA